MNIKLEVAGIPIVSVLIPTYNRATYLKIALDSVLKQNFTDFEILVLDNCSTDDTKSLLQSYDDVRIRYIQNARNLGIIRNHNKGLSLAKGKYIHVFSDDDIMIDNTCLATTIAIMEQYPTVGIVHTDISIINEMGQVVGENWASSHPSWEYIKANPLLPKATAYRILYDEMNFINMPTVLLRREFIDKYNLEFSNQLHYLLDWGLWLQLALVSDVYFVEKKLVAYRVHSKNITKSMINDSYYLELLSIKTGLASLFSNEYEFVENDINIINKSIRNQLGLNKIKLSSRLLFLIKKLI